MVDIDINLDDDLVNAAHPVEPLIVEPSMSVRDVLALLKAQRTGALLICQDGALRGIFTERDALKLIASRADMDVPIETVMHPKPATIGQQESLAAAIQKMSQGGYRRLPIVDGQGFPRGLVKVSGIVRYLVEHFPETVYNLPPEPKVAPQTREGA